MPSVLTLHDVLHTAIRFILSADGRRAKVKGRTGLKNASCETLKSEGLLPLQGPMTLLFAPAWEEPPTDPGGVLMMHQGADDPVRDLDGIELANGRTVLSYAPAGRWRIYQEAFQM